MPPSPPVGKGDWVGGSCRGPRPPSPFDLHHSPRHLHRLDVAVRDRHTNHRRQSQTEEGGAAKATRPPRLPSPHCLCHPAQLLHHCQKVARRSHRSAARTHTTTVSALLAPCAARSGLQMPPKPQGGRPNLHACRPIAIEMHVIDHHPGPTQKTGPQTSVMRKVELHRHPPC
jgi:hypothetical protein